MRLQCSHLTRFKYEWPVTRSHQWLRLSPRSLAHQRILSAAIDISPAPVSTATHLDAYGNTVTEVIVAEDHRELSILAHAEVDVSPAADFAPEQSPPWDRLAADLQSPWNDHARKAVPFCFPSPRIALDGARAFAAPVFEPGAPLLSVAAALANRIYSELDYQIGATKVDTPVADVLHSGKGVCQDFAHLAIACLRAFGLPARYVSGYVLPLDGAAGRTGSHASHAWFAVWCPRFGWVDFDPTNNLLAGEQHITLAWGRDYGDASPTTGVISGGGKQALEVDVRVVQTQSEPPAPMHGRQIDL